MTGALLPLTIVHCDVSIIGWQLYRQNIILKVELQINFIGWYYSMNESSQL